MQDPRSVFRILGETYSSWSRDECSRLGASLAFYTLLSLAPLLIVVLAIAGFAFGRSTAQAQLLDQIQQLVGPEGAAAVKSILEHAAEPKEGVINSLIGFAILIFGASGVFTELRSSLNRIWRVQHREGTGFGSLLRERIFSFGMVLAVGFLLLVSLVLSAALAAVDKFARDQLPLPHIVFVITNFLAPLVVTTFVFALLFKVLPETRPTWRAVLPGAFATAVFFDIGKLLIGLYIAKAAVGSAYGAAGSLVALIVWLYYSAQIFYFGGEFARVYSEAAQAQEGARHPARSQH